MLENKPHTLCTMTDGNHGKGVAFAAKTLGIRSKIFVPNIMSKSRIDAIRELGAEVIIVNGSYDDSIEEVKQKSIENDWCLVSDTSWEGYTEIPKNIMAGYGTIFREIEEQRKNKNPITDVIIQTGVGGLAAAACAWVELNKIKSNVWCDDVKIIIVEPLDADCMLENVKNQHNNIDKELISCKGKTNSIMAGLNCGTPSLISWPIIRDITSYFVTIGDNWAKNSMKKMHNENVIAGETGAVGVAAIMAIPSLFNENSVILTINTEADTDPDSYNNIINND